MNSPHAPSNENAKHKAFEWLRNLAIFGDSESSMHAEILLREIVDLKAAPSEIEPLPEVESQVFRAWVHNYPSGNTESAVVPADYARRLAAQLREVTKDRDMWLADSAKQNQAVGRQQQRAELAEQQLAEAVAREEGRIILLVRPMYCGTRDLGDGRKLHQYSGDVEAAIRARSEGERNGS